MQIEMVEEVLLYNITKVSYISHSQPCCANQLLYRGTVLNIELAATYLQPRFDYPQRI